MRAIARANAPRSLAVALAAALLAATSGCASRPAGGAAAPPGPAAPTPLAALVADRLVVVPTQRLRDAGALGWTAALPSPRDYLARVDDEIAFALSERGVGQGWVMPKDVVRAARRNPTYATDPYALAVAQLLPEGRAPRGVEPLAEPLATQLRTIVALGDARYVLVPVEVRLERAPATPSSSTGVTAPTATPAPAGRAVLRLALVDARASQIRWSGDVTSDTASALTPALAAALAGRVADLVAVR